MWKHQMNTVGPVFYKDGGHMQEGKDSPLDVTLCVMK